MPGGISGIKYFNAYAIIFQPIPSFHINDHHSSSSILLCGHLRNAPNGLILDLCSKVYFQPNETFLGLYCWALSPVSVYFVPIKE